MSKDEVKKKVLLVEDEDSLSEAIKLNLEMEGYQVTIAKDGQEAMTSFHSKKHDLIILDVMLPIMDGFTVCQKIRVENNRTPILFLTAKNSHKERVKGLKLGGDDYLAKPFDLEELLLRVEKLIQRSQPQEGNPSEKHLDHFEFDGNRIDFRTYEIHSAKGVNKTLTKKEIMLLKLLIDRRNEVVSREEILESIWGFDVYPSTRTIDNFILAFRKYFEQDPKNPKYFQSVRGVGYRLKIDEQ